MLVSYLRLRRVIKQLFESLMKDMPRFESEAMSRPFGHDNNYFVCAMYRSAITKAFKNRDYERLQVYSRYFYRNLPLEGVWHATAVLSETHEQPVGEIVTDAHVIAADSLLTAFREHHKYELFKNYGEYRELLSMLYEMPDKADLIISIVSQREIADAGYVKALLGSAPETPQSLSIGML